MNGRPTLEEREKARQWLEQDIRLSRKAFESRLTRERESCPQMDKGNQNGVSRPVA